MPSEERIKAKYATIQQSYAARKKSYEERLKQPSKKKLKAPRIPPGYDEYRNSIGLFYRKLVEECEKVLGDIKTYVPDYDAAQGYEITGFIWFQGWNDGIGEGIPRTSNR